MIRGKISRKTEFNMSRMKGLLVISVVLLLLAIPLLGACGGEDEQVSDTDAEALSFINLGNGFYNSGEYELALSAYDDALGMATTSNTLAIAHHNKGLVYQALGDPDAAIRAFGNAIEFDLGYAFAYYNRAVAYDSQGSTEPAIIDYTQFLEIYSVDDEFSRYARERLEVIITEDEQVSPDWKHASEEGPDKSEYVPLDHKHASEEGPDKSKYVLPDLSLIHI